jgi:hypothetical protein
MAGESLPNTKTLEVQWSAIVTQADPTWQRDLRLQREFYEDVRTNVLQDWTTRGVYADTRVFRTTEDERDIRITEDGHERLLET